MKVCIVAGSLPPEACGVGDFTAALADGLKSRGVDVVLLHRSRWTLSAIPEILGELRRESPDVVHMQYPTHGFGTSLTPHALHLALSGWPRVTTLHDYGGQRWLKHLSMSAFSLGGHVVLTGPAAKEAFCRLHPWMVRRTRAIPIGSNIPGAPWGPSGPFTIAHFGLLRPDKGIEDVLDLARLCRRENRDYRIRIVGAIIPHVADYAESLFEAAKDLPIEWHLGLTPAEVCNVLRSSHVAYLAPPAGIHERRSSLLAVAMNGTPIMAKVGWETPGFLRSYVLAANTPQEALRVIDGLNDPHRLAEQSARSVALSKLFSWSGIVDQYIDVFEACQRRRDTKSVTGQALPWLDNEQAARHGR